VSVPALEESTPLFPHEPLAVAPAAWTGTTIPNVAAPSKAHSPTRSGFATRPDFLTTPRIGIS
jgi:hypothetical protein